MYDDRGSMDGRLFAVCGLTIIDEFRTRAPDFVKKNITAVVRPVGNGAVG